MYMYESYLCKLYVILLDYNMGGALVNFDDLLLKLNIVFLLRFVISNNNWRALCETLNEDSLYYSPDMIYDCYEVSIML